MVRDGKEWSFEKDIWCGEFSLSITFPSLFVIANSKDLRSSLWGKNQMRKALETLFLKTNLWLGAERVEVLFMRTQERLVMRNEEDRLFGSIQRMRNFQSNLSILTWNRRKEDYFLWKYFETHGCLGKWCSFHGKWFAWGFWHWIC